MCWKWGPMVVQGHGGVGGLIVGEFIGDCASPPSYAPFPSDFMSLSSEGLLSGGITSLVSTSSSTSVDTAFCVLTA